MRFAVLFSVCLCSAMALAQESEQLMKYREMALAYNHDVKSAYENVAASVELVGAAKADFVPKLEAKAAYKYVGNPTQLSLAMDGLSSPLSFEGPNNQYGFSAVLSQPIYQGGRLLATLKKAENQLEYAQQEMLLIRGAIVRQCDITYWNCVAKSEIVQVAKESMSGLEALVRVIEERVKMGYTDPNDLLMAEVKLNDAEYLFHHAMAAYKSAVQGLNSLVGVDLEKQADLDSLVLAIVSSDWLDTLQMSVRPEQLMAEQLISVSEYDKKIARSRYLPQLNLGAEGVVQSPAYDFSTQPKPNYGVYAQLTIPIVEWNKWRHESRVAQHRINSANEYWNKVNDEVALEVSVARLNLKQAVEQVNLTNRSLNKSFENEKRSMERYAEGRISIMEVIQAQIFRQNAQINHIQAKLAAQNSWSDLQLAMNLYNL